MGYEEKKSILIIYFRLKNYNYKVILNVDISLPQ